MKKETRRQAWLNSQIFKQIKKFRIENVLLTDRRKAWWLFGSKKMFSSPAEDVIFEKICREEE